jgi:hypothetical protein
MNILLYQGSYVIIAANVRCIQLFLMAVFFPVNHLDIIWELVTDGILPADTQS